MPQPLINIVGQRFGGVVVLGRERTAQGAQWRYRCDCGTVKHSGGGNLRNGRVLSCGCRPKGRGRWRDLKGQRFNRLEVIAADRAERAQQFWACWCDCGGITSVSTSDLTSGNTKSCGCLRAEKGAAHLPHRRGEEHYKWRPELTERDRERHRTQENRAWSRQIWTRDKFTCRACGGRRHLHAHHLEPYATVPGLRLDPDNGVTLCAPCHKSFHMGCGYIDFGRADFFTFFGLCGAPNVGSSDPEIDAMYNKSDDAGSEGEN